MATDPISFGRAAAFVRNVTAIDLASVSLGILVVEFFSDLAALVGTIWQVVFIDPVRTLTRELSRLFAGITFPFRFFIEEAFRQTRVSLLGLELGPFAILGGVAIVGLVALIIAYGRDFAE